MFKTLMTATALTAMLIAPAAAEQGDWLIRARAINVAPDETTGGIEPGVPTGSVSVDDAWVPELDFTYFFADKWAAELILATSPHDLRGTGAVSALGKVAEVSVLPPTLTVQYHFAPDAQWRPYVGAGINYTLFYDEDSTASLDGALGPTDVDVDDAFGFALQAGIDYALNEQWFLNADVKYIFLDTDATLDTEGTINTIDVELNPVVFGLGFGRKF